MAAGQVKVFNKFIENIGAGIHNFDDTFTNGIRMGIIDNGTYTTFASLLTLSDPVWGAGGTQNMKTEETPLVSGNYPVNGNNLTVTIADADVWTITSFTVKLDLDDESILVHASNPTDAYWGIIYDDDATNKNCIAAVDLGNASAVDMTAGDFSITWNAGGLFTIAGSAPA